MKKSVAFPFIFLIVVGGVLLFFGGLSDQRLGLSPNTSLILLNPLDRDIDLDFEEMLSQGNPVNVQVIDGKLMLAENTMGDYVSEGYWESPIFDTQNVYVSYLEEKDGKVKLSFQNEWIRAAESFGSGSILFLIGYAIIVFVVIVYMIKSEKMKR